MKRLWSRLLRKLDIAQASKVAEDQHEIIDKVYDLNARRARDHNRLAADLIAHAHSISPEQGNRLKMRLRRLFDSNPESDEL